MICISIHHTVWFGAESDLDWSNFMAPKETFQNIFREWYCISISSGHNRSKLKQNTRKLFLMKISWFSVQNNRKSYLPGYSGNKKIRWIRKQIAVSRSSEGVWSSSWVCFYVNGTMQVGWSRFKTVYETLRSIFSSALIFSLIETQTWWPGEIVWSDLDGV